MASVVTRRAGSARARILEFTQEKSLRLLLQPEAFVGGGMLGGEQDLAYDSPLVGVHVWFLAVNASEKSFKIKEG